MSFLYLCSPYSHPSPEVRARRYRMAVRATARLMLEGYCIFSPIAHSHEISTELMLTHGKGPETFGHDYWLRFDTAMIAASAGLYVLTAPGWMESRGVQFEIELADRMKLSSVYAPPTEGEWEGYP